MKILNELKWGRTIIALCFIAMLITVYFYSFAILLMTLICMLM